MPWPHNVWHARWAHHQHAWRSRRGKKKPSGVPTWARSAAPAGLPAACHAALPSAGGWPRGAQPTAAFTAAGGAIGGCVRHEPSGPGPLPPPPPDGLPGAAASAAAQAPPARCGAPVSRAELCAAAAAAVGTPAAWPACRAPAGMVSRRVASRPMRLPCTTVATSDSEAWLARSGCAVTRRTSGEGNCSSTSSSCTCERDGATLLRKRGRPQSQLPYRLCTAGCGC